MKELTFQTVLALYRRRRGLLYKKYHDPAFVGSYAQTELYWNEVLIDKYLSVIDISELTTALKSDK